MDAFARLRAQERQPYFEETASRHGTTKTVVEKDFWVCWTLKQLFGLQGIPELRFKGGTSLSKVFQLIQRFSEDIDISLNRAELGFSGDRDLANPELSKTQRKALNEQLCVCIGETVRERILPALTKIFASLLGSGGWQVTASAEPHDEMTLLFHYPASFQYTSYLHPTIKIEFGRGEQQPSQCLPISPDVAVQFPEVFTTSIVNVHVLACERTFWEKVTLLHAENHRTDPSTLKSRMSRHWYDVAVMSTDARFTDDKIDETLLHQVVQFKSIYFPATWANYQTAVPGTLRIVPHPKLQEILREDFRQMDEMIWGNRLTFEEVLVRLNTLENRINAR